MGSWRSGGAHIGLCDVPDLLWGRAGRGGESWGGAPLPVSACDTDRKGLLCGHSWGPGLQEERAKLRPPSPRHQVRVAGAVTMQEPKSYGSPVTLEKVACPPRPRALAGVPGAGGSLDC